MQLLPVCPPLAGKPTGRFSIQILLISIVKFTQTDEFISKCTRGRLCEPDGELNVLKSVINTRRDCSIRIENRPFGPDPKACPVPARMALSGWCSGRPARSRSDGRRNDKPLNILFIELSFRTGLPIYLP